MKTTKPKNLKPINLILKGFGMSFLLILTAITCGLAANAVGREMPIEKYDTYSDKMSVVFTLIFLMMGGLISLLVMPLIKAKNRKKVSTILDIILAAFGVTVAIFAATVPFGDDIGVIRSMLGGAPTADGSAYNAYMSWLWLPVCMLIVFRFTIKDQSKKNLLLFLLGSLIAAILSVLLVTSIENHLFGEYICLENKPCFWYLKYLTKDNYFRTVYLCFALGVVFAAIGGTPVVKGFLEKRKK